MMHLLQLIELLPFSGLLCGSRCSLFSSRNNENIWLLGRSYNFPNEYEEFLDDFRSKIWCSYRTGFPTLTGNSGTGQGKKYQSDQGWGCMLRCGQMALAQALTMRFLGRGWRYGLEHTQGLQADKQHAQIVEWFLDDPKKPYSIHRIAQEGESLDKAVGQWFGPATVAQVIKRLSWPKGGSNCEHCLATYIAMDGVLYKDQLKKCIRNFEMEMRDLQHGSGKEAQRRDILVMVPLRIGLDCVNSIYIDQLKDMFTCPFSIGIVGGKPNSAFYFVGFQGDDVIYLNPHTTLPTLSANDGYSFTSSYHSETVGRIRFGSLDPSMALSFYLSSEDEIDLFCELLSKPIKEGATPLFVVEEHTPSYLEEDIRACTAAGSAGRMISPTPDEDYDFI